MIKIQNNTPTRESIPAFLQGLAPISLADLSWTDPALGVADCKWLPEVDQSPALGEYERYGAETLTIDGDQVIVVRAVVPWSAEEIEADKKAKVPQEVTMRQARLALHAAGLLEGVDAAIASLPEPDKTTAKIEWEYAQTVGRNSGLVPLLAATLGMAEEQIDQLFISAASL